MGPCPGLKCSHVEAEKGDVRREEEKAEPLKKREESKHFQNLSL